MSSDREGQLITFTCDECGEEYGVSGYDFRDAWDAAKDRGWRCFKNDSDEWEHRCPDCGWTR